MKLEASFSPVYSLLRLLCTLTATTVLSYVNMVCGTLRHTIPKSVVYCQVREAKRSLLDHFFTDLGKKEVNFLTCFLDDWNTYAWCLIIKKKRAEFCFTCITFAGKTTSFIVEWGSSNYAASNLACKEAWAVQKCTIRYRGSCMG